MGILVDKPGVSIVGIDPGGTTGVCVWDSWDGRMYVDHIDAGRGQRVKQRMHAGYIESKVRRRNERGLAAQWGIRDAQVQAGRGLKRGAEGERKLMDQIESGVAYQLLDIVAAVGPVCHVVMEDFVLGAHGGGSSGKRAGLSPVRIAARFEQLGRDVGLWNGDYWRTWTGHGWAGASQRGWNVEGGQVPELRRRLRAATFARVEGTEESGWSGGGVLWGGRGANYVPRMPAARIWLKGGEPAVVAALKERGMWKPGVRWVHAMDAMMHVMAFGRKLGCDIRADVEPLFPTAGFQGSGAHEPNSA